MDKPGSPDPVERLLGARVPEFTRFREAIKNGDSGLTPIHTLFGTLYPTGGEPIIARLPEAAFLRIEAETAAFLADYLPKLEREANKGGPIHDAELLRELVTHQFNLVARECMAVCASVQEFEAQLRWDIARFVCCGLSQYGWVTDPMAQELDAGFTFFMMGAKPWETIPEADRDRVPPFSDRYADFAAVADRTGLHVGAITAEALSHLALRLLAEAWKRAAESGCSKPAQAGATEGSGAERTRADTGLAERAASGGTESSRQPGPALAPVEGNVDSPSNVILEDLLTEATDHSEQPFFQASLNADEALNEQGATTEAPSFRGSCEKSEAVARATQFGQDENSSNLADEPTNMSTALREMAEQLSLPGLAMFGNQQAQDKYLEAYEEFTRSCDVAFAEEVPPEKPVSHMGLQGAVVRLSKRLATLAEKFFESFDTGIAAICHEAVDSPYLGPNFEPKWCQAVMQRYTHVLWGDVEKTWITWIAQISERMGGAAFGERVRSLDDPEHKLSVSHERRMRSTLQSIADRFAISQDIVHRLLNRNDPGVNYTPAVDLGRDEAAIEELKPPDIVQGRVEVPKAHESHPGEAGCATPAPASSSAVAVPHTDSRSNTGRRPSRRPTCGQPHLEVKAAFSSQTSLVKIVLRKIA